MVQPELRNENWTTTDGHRCTRMKTSSRPVLDYFQGAKDAELGIAMGWLVPIRVHPCASVVGVRVQEFSQNQGLPFAPFAFFA